MKNCFITSLVYLLLINSVFAQSLDEENFRKGFRVPIKNTKGETALEVAKEFIGKPYVGRTLEASPEKLICNLREFDCYTLVENVVAITNLKYNDKNSYNDLQQELTSLRYRNGKLSGYDSRIHYFTEWIEQAEANGIVTDLTKSWGKKTNKTIDFMSAHPQYYSAMNNSSVIQNIKMIEYDISRTSFYEIPKNNFPKVQNQIKNGDIIVFTSTIDGLDVNHEGFAIWQNGKLHLLHASLDYKKVMISTETLGEYLFKIKKHQGIMVLRLN